MRKRYLTMGIATMISVLSLSMLGTAFAEEADTKELALGTSSLVMTVPADYEKGELAKEDTSENQVAYFVSETSDVDFDVYQWTKATDETLVDAGKEEADSYGAELKEVTINGIDVVSYEAVEKWEDSEYETITYLAEDGNDFVEIVFWLDGDGALEKADAMINTLAKGEAKAVDGAIALGTSSLSLHPEKEYKAGEITADDTTDSQVGYFFSDDSLVDFDVYQWAKASDETLEDAAKEEAAEFEAEVKTVEINDITFAYYEATEESDGTEYTTATYLTEDDDCFVEIVFWLDGDDAAAEVEAILSTITK